MKNILVLCTGNSCRSQMAHGYLELFANKKAAIYSAGAEVHGLNPIAVKIMQEDGIDIAHHTSNHINEYEHINFDLIITVCDNAKENCPYFPGKAQRFHHNFSDPAKTTGSEQEKIAAFRKVREEIKQYCKTFVEEHLL